MGGSSRSENLAMDVGVCVQKASYILPVRRSEQAPMGNIDISIKFAVNAGTKAKTDYQSSVLDRYIVSWEQYHRKQSEILGASTESTRKLRNRKGLLELHTPPTTSSDSIMIRFASGCISR